MCEGSLGTLGIPSPRVIVSIGPEASPSVPFYPYSAGRSRCGATSLRRTLLLGHVGPVPFLGNPYFHFCLVLLSPGTRSSTSLQSHASCASIHPARPS